MKPGFKLTATAALLTAALAAPVSAENFRLSIGAGQPAESAVWLAAMRDWLGPEIQRRVAERTDHSIELLNVFGGTVCKMGECLEAVQSGLIDIADVHANFEPSKLMAHNFGLFVPFGAADPVVAAQASLTVYDRVPALKQMIEDDYGQVFIALGVVGNYNIASTFDWSTISDLAQRKIAAGGPGAQWVAGIGAVPVQTSLTEAYTSFQTGVYDGLVIQADAIVGFKLYEVIQYFTVVDFGSSPNQVITVNKRTWDGLPPEVQEIFLEVGREYTAYESQKVKESGEASLKALAAAGVNVREASDVVKVELAEALPNIPQAQTEEVKNAGQPSEAIAEYIKVLGEMGVKLPRQWEVR